MMRDVCILGAIVGARQIRMRQRVLIPSAERRVFEPDLIPMISRQLCQAALAIALAVQIAWMLTYGAATEWCFCAITRHPSPPIPPPFVLRFLELAVLPNALRVRGTGLHGVFVMSVAAGFVAVLVLLHGMALAARIRLRPAGGADGRRIRLAGAESVRPGQMLSIGCVLIGLGMAGGAILRHRWLAEAEQVFAATMAAASADRPLPAGVQFWMSEWRGDDMVDVKPEARYMVRVDPRQSGDWFLDRFVVPYSYGGAVRFESGRRYYFDVFRDGNGWSVSVNRARRPRYW